MSSDRGGGPQQDDRDDRWWQRLRGAGDVRVYISVPAMVVIMLALVAWRYFTPEPRKRTDRAPTYSESRRWTLPPVTVEDLEDEAGRSHVRPTYPHLRKPQAPAKVGPPTNLLPASRPVGP